MNCKRLAYCGKHFLCMELPGWDHHLDSRNELAPISHLVIAAESPKEVEMKEIAWSIIKRWPIPT